MTGGKMRDTLAGIFGDRASRRFAYEDATRPLVLLAAFGLLLAVAARRLALPDAWAAFPGRLLAALGARRARARAPRSAEQAEATLGALIDARDCGARTREPEAPPPATAAAKAPPPPAARPPPAAAQPIAKGPVVRSRYAPPPGSSRAPKAPPEAGSGPPSSRPLTAAEILLARRKGKGLGR